jgi:DNA ligase-1
LLALSPADILSAVYLSTNRIAPDFESVDMSIGGSTVGAAIAEATGTSKAQMRELYNSLGDLGDVALACKQRQATLMAPPPLRVAQVYGALRKIRWAFCVLSPCNLSNGEKAL